MTPGGVGHTKKRLGRKEIKASGGSLCLNTCINMCNAIIILIPSQTKLGYSVFPLHCFSFKSARVISLFGVQLSGFIHLSHVKTAIFDIVF